MASWTGYYLNPIAYLGTMFKPTTDPSLSEEAQVARDVAKVKKANDRRDMQRLIRTVMESPIHKGDEFEVAEGNCIDDYEGKNVSIQARIIINSAIKAANGDDKSREFLFKYGGFEPVKEQHVTTEIPTFVNDMGAPEPLPVTEDESEDPVEIYDDGTVE